MFKTVRMSNIYYIEGTILSDILERVNNYSNINNRS